jgi:hypothetical protein
MKGRKNGLEHLLRMPSETLQRKCYIINREEDEEQDG